MSELAALVLAAGRGERLRPLTDVTPKPLLEVGGRTLLDLALERLTGLVPVDVAHVAVNAHWLADQVVAHVGERVHLSVEHPHALGTAGAVGQVRDWLSGRDLLIANGDAYYDPEPELASFVADWDRHRPRLLVVRDEARADFEGEWRFAGVSLLPWSIASELEAVPSGLYEVVWSQVPVDLVPTSAGLIDCGTPDDLALARSLAAQRAHGHSDPGPFFHGTKAVLHVGDLLQTGYRSNFGQGKKANFIYLTATLDAATWGAELAAGDGPGRIYRVEPTGPIEDDPNLTDQRFPGNPTRSYRTRQPLRVVAEITDWEPHSPEVLQAMRDHLAELDRRGVEAINE